MACAGPDVLIGPIKWAIAKDCLCLRVNNRQETFKTKVSEKYRVCSQNGTPL